MAWRLITTSSTPFDEGIKKLNYSREKKNEGMYRAVVARGKKSLLNQ